MGPGAQVARCMAFARTTMVAALWTTAVACSDRAPPGAAPSPTASAVVVTVAPPAASSTESSPAASVREPGGIADSLPFVPTDEKIASIAWRTWVYTDTGPKRTRFGYLRAGAIVPRRGPAITNDGCPGGWYRVNPRGFVCVGHGATLALDHPVVVASSVLPRRGEGLPYVYAMAGDPGPHFYFRLPRPD